MAEPGRSDKVAKSRANVRAKRGGAGLRSGAATVRERRRLKLFVLPTRIEEQLLQLQSEVSELTRINQALVRERSGGHPLAARSREVSPERTSPRLEAAGPKWSEKAKADLWEVVAEASAENWDGADGKPIDPETGHLAERLLKSLPPDLEPPEIGASCAGAIAMYWWGPRGYSITLEIRPGGKLVYAALFGRNGTHGSEEIAEHLPHLVDVALRRVSAGGAV